MKKILIVVLIMCSQCLAANYYFSQAGNDDTGNGSLETPYKTIAKFNGLTFAAGSNVYFNKDDTWRETMKIPSSGTVSSPITISTYGTGDKPIISGADILTNASFSAVEGSGDVAIGGTTGNDNMSGGVTRNYRIIITPTSSVSTIKIKMGASTVSNVTIVGAGIGARVGSTDETGTITRITFSSSNGVTITAGQTVTSDEIAFPVVAGTEYIVTIYSTDNDFRFRTTSTGYYNTTASDQSQQTNPDTIYLAASMPSCELYSTVTYSNLYQYTLTTEAEMVWKDDVRLTKQTSVASTSLNSGWYWASNVLYVKDGTDITANSNVYEAGQRTENIICGTSITGTASDVTVDGFYCTKSNGKTGSNLGGIVLNGNRVKVQNCISYDHTMHCISVYAKAIGCVVSNCTADYGSQSLAFYGGSCRNNIVKNCILKNSWSIPVPLLTHGGATNNLVVNCNIIGNITTNGDSDMQGLVTVLDSGTQLTVQNCNFSGTGRWLGYVHDVNGGLTLRGCTFVASGMTIGGIYSKEGKCLNVQNNSFYGLTNGALFHLDDTYFAFVKYNAFSGCTTITDIQTAGATGTDFDYNCYTGNTETNGLNVDPQFTDAPNGNFRPTYNLWVDKNNDGLADAYIGAIQPRLARAWLSTF